MDYSAWILIGWTIFGFCWIIVGNWGCCLKKSTNLEDEQHLEDEHTEDTNYVPLDTLPPDYSFSSGENET